MGGKRIASLLLALLLTAGTALPARAEFTDTAGNWAEGAIRKWSEEYQIITGYEDGTFRPNASITRGAFAGILDRFMKFQKTSPAATFSDTKGTYWESAVLKLHAAQVYLGNDGKALTTDTITRQQAVTMIARAFSVTGSATALPYDDGAQIAEYARGPVAEMTSRGYITDSIDGKFRPAVAITRAEIVNILNNMVDILVQTPGTFTGAVEGTVMLNAAEGAELTDMDISKDLIIAPGVTGIVKLTNVTVGGAIRNFSDVKLEMQTPAEPENPDVPSNPDTPEIPPEPTDYPWIQPESYVTIGSDRVPVYPTVERSRLSEGDFYWEGDRLIYSGDAFDTRFGIDVSAYQNRATPGYAIDWDAVAADGVDFAMVRIGLRGYSSGGLNADAYYAQNIDGAMAAGIDTGVYIFSQAITVQEAIEEADFVIDLLKGHEISGPVAYDWEMKDATYRVHGIAPEVATACALAFCQRIEQAGYQPMIYVSRYVGYTKFNLPQLTAYPIWYPEYKSDKSEKLFPALYYQMDIWQFSSAASIDGIGGRVDVNIQFMR